MARKERLSKEELNRRRRERRAELRQLKKKRSEASKKGWETRKEKDAWKKRQIKSGRPLTDEALNKLWEQIRRFQKKRRKKVAKIIKKGGLSDDELDDLLAQLQSYNLEEIETNYWKEFRGDYAKRKK